MRNPIATKPLSQAVQLPAELLVCKKTEARCFTPVYFHSALSFKGSHIQEFSDLMDFVKANPKKVTSELLSKMEGLFEKVIRSNYKEEHFINKGSLGEVYRINEKYVFKIERNQEIDTKGFKLA